MERLNKLKNWQASLILSVVGLIVFCNSFTNPFENDDFTQIVNNVPVHSVANIKLFFEGGTFYTGGGLRPLSGVYFRPLMTTVFSVIYTLFGAHAVYYHIFQLLVCVGSSFLLFLFFRYSFKPVLALSLALIFLVHPINSETVLAIPVTQDALYFFFGILALYLLVRFNSMKGLIAAVVALSLSLFSKETGLLFIAMTLLYLFWWQRKRLASFVLMLILPVALYVALRIHAIGLWGGNPGTSPIDRLSMIERLLNAPAIFLFYISKFLFPYRLASGYYWVYSRFSVQHVLMPLIIDLFIIGLMVFLGFRLKSTTTKSNVYTYAFFGIWFGIGMLLNLQLIPLDATASDPWFYFSMVGLLGMVGMVLVARKWKVHPNVVLGMFVVLLVIVTARSFIRGFDWRSTTVLAQRDIAADATNYNAYDVLAINDINQNEYSQAAYYAGRSTASFPTYTNYTNLGVALTGTGDYAGAVAAYDHALRYASYNVIYENLSALTLVYGNYTSNEKFLIRAVDKFPKDSAIWTNVAIFEEIHGNTAGAKQAIEQATQYGSVPGFIYSGVMQSTPFRINLGNNERTLQVP